MSKRSVYRDIADLIGQRVPIRGEAGVGYVLDRDFDMPPLMLTPDEIEAAVLGAQWVAEQGDAGSGRRGARPDRQDRRGRARTAASFHRRAERRRAAEPRARPPTASTSRRTRPWIRGGRKIRIRYRDEQTRESERTIWPAMIGYAETVRLLAAWCELRQDFRHFRTDRIVAAEFLDERHGVVSARCEADGNAIWRRSAECGCREARTDPLAVDRDAKFDSEFRPLRRLRAPRIRPIPRPRPLRVRRCANS